MKRRTFIAGLGSAAAWPVVARAQQPTIPVVGFVSLASADAFEQTGYLAAFRHGLGETGYVEGQNVAVEYYWLEGKYDRLPALVAELVHRRVALIATPGSGPAARAAKAATSTIPIVFSVAQDPVQLGLVASLARPGGNATGLNFFSREVAAKRLRLLHDLIPKAVRVAVLLNPANAGSAEANLQEVQEAAPGMGMKIQILNATTVAEINAVFAGFARERPDALFLAGDGFFSDRRVQFATLTARDRIPATGSESQLVKAGLLMSYGTDYPETFRRVGEYAGRILKGKKPGELPVLQSTKFEFALNLQTAQALGIEVPPDVLSIVDEVIE